MKKTEEIHEILKKWNEIYENIMKEDDDDYLWYKAETINGTPSSYLKEIVAIFESDEQRIRLAKETMQKYNCNFNVACCLLQYFGEKILI